MSLYLYEELLIDILFVDKSEINHLLIELLNHSSCTPSIKCIKQSVDNPNRFVYYLKDDMIPISIDSSTDILIPIFKELNLNFYICKYSGYSRENKCLVYSKNDIVTEDCQTVFSNIPKTNDTTIFDVIGEIK